MKTKLFILALCLAIGSISNGQTGTLKDKYGRIMRATPMMLAKSLSTSTAFAKNVNNWIKVRDDFKMNTIRLCWLDPWYLDRGWAGYTYSEALQHLDTIVANATATGMNIIINYHNTGEKMSFYDKDNVFHDIDLDRNQTLRKNFWRGAAMRYKNNDLVYFELDNEPVFSSSYYTNSVFKDSLMAIYYVVRYEAPNRQILMFSFNQTGYDVMSVINNYTGFNWTYTSVAFHAYSGDGTSAKITDMMNSHRSYCTEWDYNGTHDYVETIDGHHENSQSLEYLGCSWSDWRAWTDNTYDMIEDSLIVDAQAKGYWWGNETKDYQAESYTANSGCVVSTYNTNYVGTLGYADFGGNGSYAEWNNINVGGGSVTLTFRYSCTNARQCDLSVNGTSVGNVAFNATASWTTWGYESKTVTLNAGNNTIRLTANSANGGPNVDMIHLVGVAANLALNKTATQSSTYSTRVASNAVDGSTDGVMNNGHVSHTNSEANAWWHVDLGAVYNISDIKIWNRTDCCASRLDDYYVFVSDNAYTSTDLNTTKNQSGVTYTYLSTEAGRPTYVWANRSGRYIRVQLSGTNYLHIAEVEVRGNGLKRAFSNVTASTDNSVSVYPNPANEYITITGLDDKNYQVSVFDIQGKNMGHHIIENGLDANINIEGLPAGMYLLRVQGQNMLKTIKFSKVF